MIYWKALYEVYLTFSSLLKMYEIQYIPRNMHTVFALLCFIVVIHWLIFPYPSRLLHWHCGNLTIAPVPAKQPWWIWINISCEFNMNDCITTTKQSTTKPCAYFLGYTVCHQQQKSSHTSNAFSINSGYWLRRQIARYIFKFIASWWRHGQMQTCYQLDTVKTIKRIFI